MDWQTLTRNWPATLNRMQIRFPYIDADRLPSRPSQRDMVHHLSRTHQLTLFEAREELDDWLFAEGLARQADRLAG